MAAFGVSHAAWVSPDHNRSIFGLFIVRFSVCYTDGIQEGMMAIKQPQTMSVTEFKAKLGTIASTIGDQPIVVENHGEPRLMVFSAESGEALIEELERARRQAILRRFEAIQTWNDEHNADLTDENELLERVVQEVRAYRAEERTQSGKGRRS